MRNDSDLIGFGHHLIDDDHLKSLASIVFSSVAALVES